jgi:hypothetical protein
MLCGAVSYVLSIGIINVKLCGFVVVPDVWRVELLNSFNGVYPHVDDLVRQNHVRVLVTHSQHKQ